MQQHLYFTSAILSLIFLKRRPNEFQCLLKLTSPWLLSYPVVLILDFSDRHWLAAVSLKKRERFYLKYLQLDNHICSGGVGAAFPEAVAQSGQALWPFKSQIPGSNPGRSNNEPMTACRSIRKIPFLIP